MNTRDDLPAPDQGLVLTHFLTVRDVARSRDFYADIFGGRVVLEENPASSRSPTAGSS
jgi:predicted enzyme related to lactoylglutathione lyase